MFFDSLKELWGVNFGEGGHYGWYCSSFADEINTGVVEVKRGLSWEVLASFPDNYFDYVYLDAAHDFISVRKDVDVLVKKVKSKGFIQFNDYTIYDWVARCPYGVVPVVNEMIEQTESDVMYFCLSNNGFNDIVVKLNK